MTTNFRNKQWFKDLPQDEKDKICKKFNINEDTLRKAGRLNDDGEIVIDLIRIDHLVETPKTWDDCNDKLSDIKFNDNIEISDIENMLDNIKNIYQAMNPDVKFLKYKESIYNNILVKQAYKYLKTWFVKKAKANSDDNCYIKYCSHLIYTHSKCLLESDLKLIKK